MSELDFITVKEYDNELWVKLPQCFSDRHGITAGDTLVIETANMYVQIITTKTKARRDRLLEQFEELNNNGVIS